MGKLRHRGLSHLPEITEPETGRVGPFPLNHRVKEMIQERGRPWAKLEGFRAKSREGYVKEEGELEERQDWTQSGWNLESSGKKIRF